MVRVSSNLKKIHIKLIKIHGDNLECVWMKEFKILRISNNWNSFIFKILCFDKKNKNCEGKISECKTKKIYDWCASKEDNIDAT